MFREPKEIQNAPGFYEIPGFDNYGISREGVVINRATNSTTLGYVTERGYCRFNLIMTNGETYNAGRHRLLCMTFKDDGRDFSNFHVNHINLVPGDDRLENLEWLSCKENVRHALQSGKSNDSLRVQTKHAYSGVVETFDSIGQCSKHNNLSIYAVRHRLRLGPNRVAPDRKQYRFYSMDPWPSLNENDVNELLLLNDCSIKVSCKHLISGIVLDFDSVTDLSKFLGFTVSAVAKWLREDLQPVVRGGFLIKYRSDNHSWREIETEEEMYAIYNSENGRSSIVQVVENDTGLCFTYWSAVEAAKCRNISPEALNFRLKSAGNTVFKDGCRYGYWPI